MEQKCGDSETSRDMRRNGSPEIEAGFNGEKVENNLNFPSKLSGGQDIMSIIMKRRVGGGAVVDEDTEPVAKKARWAFEETAKVELRDMQIETKSNERHEICDSVDDNCISFKDIKADIDVLNGKESFKDAGPFSVQQSEDNTSKVSMEKTESCDDENVTEKCKESTASLSELQTIIDVKNKSEPALQAITKTEPEIVTIINSEPALQAITKTELEFVNIIDTSDKPEPEEPSHCKPQQIADSDLSENLSKWTDKLTSSKLGVPCSASISKLAGCSTETEGLSVISEANSDCDYQNKPCSLNRKDTSKETAVCKRKELNLSSDLDVLAAAAEKQEQMDTKCHVIEESERSLPIMTKDARGEKRKSRKQKAPQRIAHVPSDDPAPNVEGYEDEQILTDELQDMYRNEKSRKQNNPQRVTELTDYYDQFYNNDKTRSSTSKEKGDENEIENEDSAVESFYTNLNDREKSNIFSDGNISIKNMMGTPNFQQHAQDASGLMLPVSPFHNAMLATLSQSMYQNTGEHTEKDQIGISNLEENLDVVRRLREIRFYKYRKISVAEKQEIASYAKLHSVSSAAAHFGVSKSAVSMWTRTDFTDMKDELGKRKRNCMLGNEKFEQLVERVKNEKGNKFKGLTKQDKFEVSRYAKLVGVREMARCLGIALGTVSGWMRQFPYTVKPTSQEEESSNASTGVNDDSINDSRDDSVELSIKIEKVESLSYNSEDWAKTSHGENESVCVKEEPSDQKTSYKIKKSEESEFDEKNWEESSKIKIEINNDTTDGWEQDDNSKASTETVEYDKEGLTNDTDDPESQSGDKTEETKSGEEDSEVPSSFNKSDELDEMIAETLMVPDIDQCYENIKEQIKYTPLENDLFFESLFRRVLSCRADKYKTLKASEKLEVVRYAKRIGVRKVAKLLGLATGTLSGWNTKYQAHLGLTMEGSSTGADLNQSLESSPAREIPACLSNGFENVLTPDSQSNLTSTPQSSSVLDNAEKSEVTAIKFLLKDQFPLLQEKIAIARQIKFRNIKPSEKIEIVKCAKLVGIRPTARVLGMPIGTLSGWITKYTNTLHPVYHIDNPENVDYPGNAVPDLPADPNNVNELLRNDLVGRNVPPLNSPQTSLMSVPQSNMTPAGIGLVSGMSNSFSHNFISNLNTTTNPQGITKDQVSDSYEKTEHCEKTENRVKSGESVDNIVIEPASDVGMNNVNLDEETKRMAEHYVRMFQEAQMMKFS